MHAHTPYLADVTNAPFPRKPPLLRAMQKPEAIFVGASGGEGSYTQLAAQQYVKRLGIKKSTIEPLVFVEDVLRKLQDKEIDVGIFGIVNSIGGVVEEYMPFLGHFRWSFVEVIKFEVNHMLLALPETKREEIRKIVSQEQALRQCLNLRTRWDGVDFGDYIDTATAAKDLREGRLPPDTAVIAPVMWVVRISDCESLVTSAFCRPIMKHRSMTVNGTNSPCTVARRAPSTPKPSSSSASTSSGNAYSLCRCWRRA